MKKCKYCNKETEEWNDYCDEHKEKVEFIEKVIRNYLEKKETKK